jgi:hypothetical protein
LIVGHLIKHFHNYSIQESNMKSILTREDAENFIKGCIIWIGPGFHPDTQMAEYETPAGDQLFSISRAFENQAKLNACFKLLGNDIYIVGNDLLVKLGYAPAIEPDSANGGEQTNWSKELVRLSLLIDKAIKYLRDDVVGVYGELEFPAVTTTWNCVLEGINGEALASNEYGQDSLIQDLSPESLFEVCEAVQKAIAGRGEA